jgi:hypothetical protein
MRAPLVHAALGIGNDFGMAGEAPLGFYILEIELPPYAGHRLGRWAAGGWADGSGESPSGTFT